jgi:hypothetical protein
MMTRSAGFATVLSCALLACAFRPATCSALSLGPEILVNDDTSGGCPQLSPDMVFTSGGRLLVVWEDHRRSDYDVNIYCQCYDSNGVPIDTNHVVNGDTVNRDIWAYRQTTPAIASLPSGRAAVCWQDYREGECRVYYRILDGQGRLAGLEHSVPAEADSQVEPDVAALNDRFVLVWKQFRGAAEPAICGVMVDSSGNAGASFDASDYIPGDSLDAPSVAGGNYGFVVAWSRQAGVRNVALRWFDAEASPRGPAVVPESDAARRPRVASDSFGNSIVVWEEAVSHPAGVWGMVFDPTGAARVAAFRVSDSLETWNYHPCVAAEPDGKRFIVSWEDGRNGQPLIYARVLDSLGAALTPDFPLDNSPNLQAQGSPSVALISDSEFAAAWVDNRYGDQDIYAANRNGPVWVISRVNSDTASSIQDFPVVTMDSSGCVSAFWFDYRASPWNASIYGQRFDGWLTPIGRNFRVSDLTNCQCTFLWAATNSIGVTTVVWQDYRKGDPDIFGQIYDARGNPRGTNFRVNDDLGSAEQTWPTVSINDSGYFVVAWMDARTGLFAPFAQRFDNLGNRMGENVQVAPSGGHVSTLLLNSGAFWVAWGGAGVHARRFDIRQQLWDTVVTVADDSLGGCVYPRLELVGGNSLWAVWMNDRRDSWDVYAQRLSCTGQRLGGNFRVNDDTAICQHWLPSLAWDDRNRVILAWADFRRVGNLDIRARVYDTCGAAADTSFIVNSDPNGNDHQWSYRSVAARNGRVAYGWTDNRRFQSWDFYIRGEIESLPSGHARFRLDVRPSIAGVSCSLSPSRPATGTATIEVFDVMGRRMRRIEGAAISRDRRFVELDCRGLVAGVYQVMLTVGRVSFTGRIVVLR